MGIELKDELQVYFRNDQRIVKLFQGDITSPEATEQADYLAVSVFPGDYTETPGSVITALAAKGVHLSELAKNKAVSYIDPYACWISQPVEGQSFKRIICLEAPIPLGDATFDLVTYLFSAIAEFQKDKKSDVVVALPMLCCGYGRLRDKDMLEALFYAAVHWGAMEFPFREIRLVYFQESQNDALQKVFTDLKYKYEHLESLFQNQRYQFYASQALNGAAEDDEYLTPRQRYAIRLYTGNYYMTINRILRENNKKSEEYIRHKPLFEAMDTAVRNLPLYLETVYRGEGTLSPQRRQENMPGNHVTNLAYTSTAYQKIGFYYRATRFDIQSLTGTKVEQYSVFPNEKEVTMERGLCYCVTDAKDESGYRYIAAKEDEQGLRR